VLLHLGKVEEVSQVQSQANVAGAQAPGCPWQRNDQG